MSTKLKYVMRVSDDLHYFRHDPTFDKPVRLRGLVGSPEYVEHHATLLAQVMVGKAKPLHKAVAERVVEYLPGSLGWVIERFLVSRKFVKPAPAGYSDGTKVRYRILLSAIKEKCGGCPINIMRRSHVRKLCDEVEKASGASTADAVLRLISQLWKFARDVEECKIDEDAANPASGHEARYAV